MKIAEQCGKRDDEGSTVYRGEKRPEARARERTPLVLQAKPSLLASLAPLPGYLPVIFDRPLHIQLLKIRKMALRKQEYQLL
jgi:hypothetical protein